jgi:hypothetical protein
MPKRHQQPFDVALAEGVGEVNKPELAYGVVVGCQDVRDRALSALLANAGRRRAVRLAPLPLSGHRPLRAPGAESRSFADGGVTPGVRNDIILLAGAPGGALPC